MTSTALNLDTASPTRPRIRKQKPPYQPGRFASIADLVAAGIGSRAKIYRLIETGDLPKPVMIGAQQHWTPSQSEAILSGEWFLSRANAAEDVDDDEV